MKYNTRSFPRGTRKQFFKVAPETYQTLLEVMVAKDFANLSVALAYVVRNGAHLLVPEVAPRPFMPLPEEIYGRGHWRPRSSMPPPAPQDYTMIIEDESEPQ